MNRKRLEDISEIRAGCLFAPVAVVCVPFLVLGTLMAVLSYSSASTQVRSNAATERIMATITSSSLGQINTGGKQTRQTAMIEFAYQRDGVEQASDHYFPVNDPNGQVDAKAIVERLPVGASIEVWLPNDPDLPAFIEKHWNPSVYSGVGVGLFAWAFCGFLLTVCGGWRWVGRAWLGAWVLSLSILGLGAFSAWHAISFVPAGLLPTYMVPMAIGVGASSLLPLLGAWQASRIATALREIE